MSNEKTNLGYFDTQEEAGQAAAKARQKMMPWSKS